jgi:hypothetical protein
MMGNEACRIVALDERDDSGLPRAADLGVDPLPCSGDGASASGMRNRDSEPMFYTAYLETAYTVGREEPASH